MVARPLTELELDRPAIVLGVIRNGAVMLTLDCGVNPTGHTPAGIRHAMSAWRLAGPWRRHRLRGTRAELSRVLRDSGVRRLPAAALSSRRSGWPL
jgi:hypothetical protein